MSGGKAIELLEPAYRQWHALFTLIEARDGPMWRFGGGRWASTALADEWRSVWRLMPKTWEYQMGRVTRARVANITDAVRRLVANAHAEGIQLDQFQEGGHA